MKGWCSSWIITATIATIIAIERLRVTLWGYGALRRNRGYLSNPHEANSEKP
ncbi:MAG: hypothetical protein ACO2OZ_06035 [Acidilobaceae archaeon]